MLRDEEGGIGERNADVDVAAIGGDPGDIWQSGRD